MAEFADVDTIESSEDALQVILQSINLRIDPRMALWCVYPSLDIDQEELEQKVEKNTARLEKETETELTISQFWCVGVPRLKVDSRGVPHLSCHIDLHFVACDTTDPDRHLCWYGKLVKKADSFDCPLCLIPFLSRIRNQKKRNIQKGEVRIVERAPGYSIYALKGKEWRIPDAFVGFLWALGERNKGFEGLLDPDTCLLMTRLAKETPYVDTPKSPAQDASQEVVAALEGLGYPKATAKDAAQRALQESPGGSLEDRVRKALAYLGNS